MNTARGELYGANPFIDESIHSEVILFFIATLEETESNLRRPLTQEIREMNLCLTTRLFLSQ